MSEKRKIWVWAALLWLFIGAAVLFGMTGIYAYVTDRESTANIITAGEVTIHLEEPNWPGKTALVAGQTVSKDPRIINDGENNALVFLRVSVPNKVITILNEDGSMGDKEGLSELFYFRYLNGNGEMVPGFNTTGTYKDPAAEGAWTELWGREVVGRTDEEFTEYVFGYSLPIRPDESTGPLFDAVKFKKVLEGYSEKSQLNPDTEYPIVLDAYAIQAEDILDNVDHDITDALDEGRGLNEEELTEIWDIYFNQNDPDHSSMHDYTPNDDRFEFMEYIPEPSRPRKEGYTLRNGRRLIISPDIIADFRALSFADASFSMVVLDPPHLERVGDNAWMGKKYGRLNKDAWRDDSRQRFKEAFRVLRPHGVLIF